MRRRMVTMLALLPLGVAPVALAGERGPVCREQSVVDEMTREIRAQNYYSIVNPKLVTEQETADPRVVRCQVCVQSTPYNTTQFGDRPVAQCLPHGFEVKILPSGFVVRNLR